MKKIISTTLLFLSLFILLQSHKNASSKSEKPSYSCNPSIDKWVKDNFAELQKLNRSEISGILDIEKQTAIFRSLSDQKKYSIWIEKYNYLIKSSEFNQLEKEHIVKLFSKFSPQIYSDSKLFQNIYDFYQEWSREGEKKFDWSPVDLAYISQTWLTKSEILNIYNSKISAQNLLPDCNCLSTWWCISIGRGYCEAGTSCGASGGCGLFSNQTCTGVCTFPNE